MSGPKLPSPEEVGKILSARLRLLGISQKTVQGWCLNPQNTGKNASAGAVSNWIHGRNLPDTINIVILAYRLDISIYELLGIGEDPTLTKIKRTLELR